MKRTGADAEISRPNSRRDDLLQRLSRLSRYASVHFADTELLDNLDAVTHELETVLQQESESVPSHAIRVAVADDHRAIRETIADRLSDEPDFSVVGTAADCGEVRAMVADASPDVVLLDVTMPGGNGIDLIRELRPQHDRSRFLVFTMHRQKSVFDEAMNAGAAGFLTKFASPVEIINAVREVHQGGCALHVTFEGAAVGDPASRLQRLSPREQAVLKLIASGYSAKETAGALGLKPATVDTYRHRLVEKLGVRSKPELVRFALDAGVLC